MEQAIYEEQQRYYDARAEEYDDWWRREGAFAAAPNRDLWLADTAKAEAFAEKCAAGQRVLELAVGTGNFTRVLAPGAKSVHAVDGSEPMPRVCRGKAPPRTTFEQADLLGGWQPPAGEFDVVFAGFFLSHLDDEQLGRLLTRVVAPALAPGGAFAAVDSARAAKVDLHHREVPGSVDREERELGDGRRFRIVKVYRSAGQWREAVERLSGGALVADAGACLELEHFVALRFTLAGEAGKK